MKLFDAIRSSDDRLEDVRSRRREAYQEYAGRFAYEDDGQKRPMNLIAKAVDTFVPYIASRNPTHRFGAYRMAAREPAARLGLAVDRAGRELKRVQKTRLTLVDAFLSPMAVVKVGHKVGSEMIKVNGRWYNKGQPYILNIDWDDYVFDPAARCVEEALFEGHFYRVRRDDALESGIFAGKEDIIEGLPSLQDGRCGTRRQERHEDLSRAEGPRGRDYDLVDMVELVDLYIHDEIEPLIVTLPASEDYSQDYLRVEPYQGPEGGPYHRLEFYPVKNQPFGIPPVARWREQSETFYDLLNKAVREILKSKNLLVGTKSQEDDLETVRDAEDQDTVLMDDPAGAKNLMVGAVLPDLTPMAEMFLGMFNVQANNPDLLSGQTGGTDKATIYSGQQASATALLEDIQNTHDAHEEGISRSLAWHFWTDPHINIATLKRLPGGEWIEMSFTPEDREGDFIDFEVKLKPRSMQRQDQSVRARRIIELLDVILRSVQVAMSTGGYVRPDKVTQIIANEFDIDELDEIVNDPMLSIMHDQLYATASASQGMNPAMAMMGGMGMGQPMGGAAPAGGTSNEQTKPGSPRQSAMAPAMTR